MDNSKKRTLIIIGIIETIILIFCLVVSIIVWVTFIGPDTQNYQTLNLQKNGAFIGTLQNNNVLFFCSIVLPLFIIFLVDAIYLIFYATKKESAITDKERESIEDEARKQARAELLAEMNGQKPEVLVSSTDEDKDEETKEEPVAPKVEPAKETPTKTVEKPVVKAKKVAPKKKTTAKKKAK
jgi:hypothetical protein